MRPRDVETTLRRWSANPDEFIGDMTLENGSRFGDVALPWQWDFIRTARTSRLLYAEAPRGSAKTFMTAMLAVEALFLGPPRGRYYAVAGDADQARLLHDAASGIIERSALLRSSATIERSAIKIPSTGSMLVVLSADAATVLGLTPDGVFCDETASWAGPNAEELFYAVLTAVSKRPQSRLISISTPGWSLTHFAKGIRDAALEGRGGWRYWCRNTPAEFTDRALIEAMRQVLPEHVWRRYYANEWTSGNGAFLTLAEVERIFDASRAPATQGVRGRAYIGTLDLGLAHDAAVLMVGHLEGDVVCVDLIRTWKGSPRDRVRIEDVEAEIEAVHRAFPGIRFCADPWQMVGSVQRLVAKGIAIEERPFTAQYRIQIDSTLLKLAREGRIRCFPYEALRRELLEVEVEATATGWRVQHKSGKHDDHVTALGMLVYELVTNPPPAPIDPAVAAAFQRARFYPDLPGIDDWSTRSDAELLRPSSRRVYLDEVDLDLPRVRPHSNGIYTT